MKLKYFAVLLFLSIFFNIDAQTKKNEVLFTVADDSVSIEEFLRVYNKNLDLVQDESQKDVDEYLNLFTNYKLKLKEAKALGLAEKPSYIRELSNYRQQLAKNFLTDNRVTDKLVEEAYERISNEVKAAHILIKVAQNASPQDTLVAYNDIARLRDRALEEGFEKVMKEVHNGQTIYGEDLGYFSGFKMVYPFESAAYNTKVGEISKPFKTQFGYHIVYVMDKRKSRGERTVAHIMVIDKKGDTIPNSSQIRIQEIYKKLQQGEDFAALAKQFSDDSNSAPKGGMLMPFSGGQLSSPEFEETAFSLSEIGDISAPFKSQYGWHIVKLFEKKPVDSFDTMKPELEAQVKRDARSKIIDDALHSKLRKKYNVNEKQPSLAYFTSLLNEDYYKRTWELPADFEAKEPLVKIGEKQLTFQDFGDYLVKNQRSIYSRDSFDAIVSKAYESFLNENITAYQEDNLENENEEFAHIVGEYRDGLLLFDLMEQTIWNTAKTDSLDIQNYYENHKDAYYWPERASAVVASSANQKVLKKVSKLMEGNMELEQIKKLVNNNGEVNVIFTADTMDAKHQALPKNYKFNEGLSKVYKHNDAYVLVQVKEILPKKFKTFEEAKGTIIGDYQTFKENNWIQELKKKYPVVINPEALNKVKSQIKKQ